MKLIFSFFIIIFISQPLFSKNYEAQYNIKTKGLLVGRLFWNLEINDVDYKVFIKFKSKGVLSAIYNFNGNYETIGRIINGNLTPLQYSQFWKTKNKQRDVKIIFFYLKIIKLNIEPKEKELPRIKYLDLINYSDPLTSFLNILLKNIPSYTIDGRRTYLLSPIINKNSRKIITKEYKNIWADHKRNNLEYLEFYQNKNEILPDKITIMFKGSLFYLTKF